MDTAAAANPVPTLLYSATVPWLGGVDLALSLFYTALFVALLVLTYLSLSRR